MVPAALVALDRLPLTANGKLDVKALPAPEYRSLSVQIGPRSELEKQVAESWRSVLGVPEVGVHDNFFDLGGNSLLLVRVLSGLQTIRNDLRMVDLFRYTTIEALAGYLSAPSEAPGAAMTASRARATKRRAARRRVSRRPRHRVSDTHPSLQQSSRMDPQDRENDIAVIGMSARLPGAHDVDEFWSNLCAGVESICFFTRDELLAAGVSPHAIASAGYVPAYAPMPDAFAFDAAFFDVSPREAQVMDPQQRVFLECAWSALEHAGYDPRRFPGPVGVFGGSASTSHGARIRRHADLVTAVGPAVVEFASSRDFLTTRVSYRLGLTGPSLAVQTACSTSLVAIHLACQSLLNCECDLALAGGVTLSQEQVRGYQYQEGGIFSPDGHCRALDARAAGTVGGSGVGIVVLRRLGDALRDGETIHAVVKGSAINNDGSSKIGFTAPSITGQAHVIAEALGVAGVDPSTIAYVEAHGTGTPLGDPVEIAALTEAFRASTSQTGFCALGSVKTNIGHVDCAAGVAGFIKAVLVLKHGTVPPTLHFERASAESGLEASPFWVNAALTELRRLGTRLRAGVSSLGIGGTNAHVVLEEPPVEPAQPPSDARPHVLILSAKTAAALGRMRSNLALHLARHPELQLADVAYTLQEGRAAFAWRSAVVARELAEVPDALMGAASRSPVGCAVDKMSVAFLFPGQGTQYAGMARDLYQREAVFRTELDRCADALVPYLGLDLRSVLFCAAADVEKNNSLLRQTRYTQPALFAVEYALARLWMSWGVQPQAMLGHSIGEYVAACLAGVFDVEAALGLVAARGRLIGDLAPGAMLAVPLSEHETRSLLPPVLSLAAVNSPAHCVVSGDARSIEEFEQRLGTLGVAGSRLHTSHAFHSAALDPILDAFALEVTRARPAPPRIPFLANVTGNWITTEQAVDPRVLGAAFTADRSLRGWRGPTARGTRKGTARGGAGPDARNVCAPPPRE